jgi:ABC-2 type transport system permease protein
MSGAIARASAVMRKEALHIIRDPQTLFIVIVMPAIMMFIFGYAFTADMRDVRVAVEDLCRSGESRAVTESIDATDMFSVVAVEGPISDPRGYFKNRRVKAIIRIPANFALEIRRQSGGATVQVLIDGSDSNLGNIIRNATEAAILDPVLKVLKITKPEPVIVHQSVLYNPQQKSAFFFVPGLMVLILSMMSALLTSVALVREKEMGTMAQLVVSPLRPAEILAGKLVPYMFLAAVDGAMVLLIGRLAFGVTICGSVLLLASVSLLYVIVMLSFGLLISSITSRQLHAMFAAIIVTMLPIIMLTGYVFPVDSMPIVLQWLSAVIPATYFLKIVRAIILKGTGLDMLWQPIAILALQAVILIGASIKRFRMTA